MKIKIAFILDHKLMNYRIPFFNWLVERGYEVTIFHSDKSMLVNEFPFKIISTKTKSFSGLIYRTLPNLNEFDIVVCMQNIRVLNLWFLTLNPFRRFKLVHWGIGTSSAKGLSLNKTLFSYLRNFLAKFSNAQILYSSFSLPLFSKNVLEKTFIANNTIYNPFSNDLSTHLKDSFLFIGSLNRRKGLSILLHSFSKFLNSESNLKISKLIIIGDGPIKDELINLSNSLEISSNVHFVGNITKDEEKKDFFSRAIVSISPLQAGLSVLESFSYGVPFICYSDAISGGEHLNIKNDYNGFYVKSADELSSKMHLLNNDIDLASKLGQNAFVYYFDNRQMKHMVDEFDSCFKFCINK